MTVNEILLEMDAQRNRQDAEARKKKDEFLAQNPGAVKLLSERSGLLLDMLKSRLNGEKKDISDKIEDINKRIERELGRGWQSAFEPARSCAACGDTGYVNAEGRKKMCACLRERIYREIYHGEDIEGLEGSFKAFNLGVFPEGAQREQMARACMLAKSAVKTGEPNLLAFLGSSGLGKSYLMSCMAKALNKQGKSVLYINAFSLFDVFHRKRLGEDLLLQPIFDADAVFIDDLGTEPMTANITREYLFKLISERSGAHRFTAAATNLTTRQLQERYTEKVTSRFFGIATGARIVFEGRDIRISG